MKKTCQVNLMNRWCIYIFRNSRLSQTPENLKIFLTKLKVAEIYSNDNLLYFKIRYEHDFHEKNE